MRPATSVRCPARLRANRANRSARPDPAWQDGRVADRNGDFAVSIIHRTTLTPSKLEVIAPWLAAQSWYEGGVPELEKMGGFRLDDPTGRVGIEFMIVGDTSGEQPHYYHVPMTYRAEPLADLDHALLGTAQHGVLGERWFYDGAHDPVLVAQLLALFAGTTQPQMQSVSETVDPTVRSDVIGSASGDVTIVRSPLATPAADVLGTITAPFRRVDGSEVRGVFATLG